MTDLSYTAWDDNKYPWPPPAGWYQASDGKWWPEGYGPPNDVAVSGEDDRLSTHDAEDAAETITAEKSVAAEEPGAPPTLIESSTPRYSAPSASTSDYSSSDYSSPRHSSTDDSEPSEFASAADTSIETIDNQTTDSSVGLAGWAQAGTTDRREPIEAVEAGSAFDAGTDNPVDSAMNRFDDLQRKVESQDFGLGSAAGVVGAGAAGMAVAGVTADATSDATSSMSTPEALDLDAPEVDLPDISEVTEIETTDFSDLAGAEASDLGEAAGSGYLDPRQTLDIDPDELATEVNPYYNGQEDGDLSQNGYSSAAGFEAGAPAGGYQAAPAGASGQQVGAVADEYRSHASAHGSNVLTPVSTPAPTSGNGRRLLYVFLGLLALAAAGFAGYVLFQLQGDDDVSAAESAEAATGVVDNQIGSFGSPHQPDKGVRISVPVGDSQDRDWMLEVRELATTSNVGDNLEIVTTLRIRNDTPTEELSLDNLRFNLVTSDGGDAIAQNDSCSRGSDLDRSTLIAPGKTAAGTVCWTVPADQASTALLAVESTTASGRVHVRIS